MALTLSESNKYSTGRLKLAKQKAKSTTKKQPKTKMPMKAPGMGESGMVKMKQVTPAQMAKMGC